MIFIQRNDSQFMTILCTFLEYISCGTVNIGQYAIIQWFGGHKLTTLIIEGEGVAKLFAIL